MRRGPRWPLTVGARLAGATTRQARGRDVGETLAVGAVRAADLAVEGLDWDGAAVDWAWFG